MVYLPRCLGPQRYSKKHYAQAFFEKKIQKNLNRLNSKEIIFKKNQKRKQGASGAVLGLLYYINKV